MDYRTTDIESWLESTLKRSGAALTAPRTVLERGLPPMNDHPIISRDIVGTTRGRYERYVTRDDHLPISTVERVYTLDMEPEAIEEVILLELEPEITFTTRYLGERRSEPSHLTLDKLRSAGSIERLLEACRGLPVPDSNDHASVERLVHTYWKDVIERLIKMNSPKHQ